MPEAQVLQGASYVSPLSLSQRGLWAPPSNAAPPPPQGSILMGVAMLSGAGGMGADPYASKLCAAVMWGEDGWYQGLLLPEAEEDVIPNLGTWTWHWSEGENGGAALYRARARSFAGI